MEWVFALGPATDATLPGIAATVTGGAVPARTVVGRLPPDVPHVTGRAPRSGEAVAGGRAAAALGLRHGSGEADAGGRRVAVVGTVAAAGPLGLLDDTVLIADDAGTLPVRYVYLRAASGYDVDAVASRVADVVPSERPSAVEVEVAQGVLDLRGVVSGTLGRSSRQLMATVLGVGLVLVALTTTAAVGARRRDFGRQRALGASRSAIVALVVTQAVVAGGAGAVLGTSVGVLVVRLVAGLWLPWTFVAALVVVAQAVNAAGAVLPAVLAARRDPVRILRVP